MRARSAAMARAQLWRESAARDPWASWAACWAGREDSSSGKYGLRKAAGEGGLVRDMRPTRTPPERSHNRDCEPASAPGYRYAHPGYLLIPTFSNFDRSFRGALLREPGMTADRCERSA